LDEITAKTIPKRSKDRVKKVPVIPESGCEIVQEKGHKSRPRPTVLVDLKSPNPPIEKSKRLAAVAAAVKETKGSESLPENAENESSNTPKWRKKLADTSSGIWQSSANKLTTSKANVSNRLTSVVQLAKKVSYSF